MSRTIKRGLEPVGHQVITLTDSTAVAVNSTCRGGQFLIWSVETNNVRMRCDGTDPTLTTGVLFTKDLAPYTFDGYNGTSLMKFQRSTGSASVQLSSYKYTGAK